MKYIWQMCIKSHNTWKELSDCLFLQQKSSVHFTKILSRRWGSMIFGVISITCDAEGVLFQQSSELSEWFSRKLHQ